MMALIHDCWRSCFGGASSPGNVKAAAPQICLPHPPPHAPHAPAAALSPAPSPLPLPPQVLKITNATKKVVRRDPETGGAAVWQVAAVGPHRGHARGLRATGGAEHTTQVQHKCIRGARGTPGQQSPSPRPSGAWAAPPPAPPGPPPLPPHAPAPCCARVHACARAPARTLVPVRARVPARAPSPGTLAPRPCCAEDVVVERRVWNWVVANISLMAFGTSAPEILLS